VYKEDDPEYAARKKAIIAESKKRLGRLDGYIEKKKWYEVKNELDRYMYETRGAVRGLAKTTEQKAAATDFFKAIEKTNLTATLKKQDACKEAAGDAVSKLDAFVATL
jgi:photosystem II oxygen-evolving enhancer protein 3